LQYRLKLAKVPCFAKGEECIACGKASCASRRDWRRLLRDDAKGLEMWRRGAREQLRSRLRHTGCE